MEQNEEAGACGLRNLPNAKVDRFQRVLSGFSQDVCHITHCPVTRRHPLPGREQRHTFAFPNSLAGVRGPG